MRLHGDRASNDRRVFRKDGSEALFTGGDNEIWSFGSENETILKNYILIREILRSYIRTLMQEVEYQSIQYYHLDTLFDHVLLSK